MNSAEYWEGRYHNCGTSGAGSIGEIREWKWKVINKYAGHIDDLIDVGCGDLSFYEGRAFPKRYTGIDVSPTIIMRNRQRHPGLRFVCSSASTHVDIGRARVVFCLDVLFHILDDHEYEKILVNLTKYSELWIFVHTWGKNPFSDVMLKMKGVCSELLNGNIVTAVKLLCAVTSDGSYQKFRKFDDSLPIFEKRGFRLIAAERNTIVNPYGTLYVLKRQMKDRILSEQRSVIADTEN